MMNSPQIKSFQCGGAVDPSDQVYIVRETDAQLLHLMRQRNHCNLHAGRQAGKTSLMMNVRDALRGDGHQCIDADLSIFFGPHTLHEGLTALGNLMLGKMHGLYGAQQASLVAFSPDSRMALEQTVEVLLQRVMAALPGDEVLYLFFDEVDILMRYPPSEVFAFFIGLRSFLQRPDLHQHRLVLLLVSVLTPTEMIASYNTGGTSINFTRDLPLLPFANSAEVRRQFCEQAFAQHSAELADQVVNKVLTLTGGQPFLTALLGQELQWGNDLEHDFAKASESLLYSANSIAKGHFDTMRKQLFDMGDRVFALLQTYLEILQGKVFSVSQGGWNATALTNIALLRLGDGEHYEVANPLYRQRFNADWVQEMMSERETISLSKQFKASLFSKRIALILCGGTVGMVTIAGHSGFQGASDVLMHFIENDLTQIARIEAFPLYQLDGINMTPIEWRGIADLIYQRWEDFDGFVVAHGTDTLAYTASAVALMLGRVSKPVVFTGAQTSINLAYGDARANLFRACYVAAHDDAPLEVQLCFDDVVLRAVRAEKKDDRLFGGFHSPAWPPLARVTESLLPNRSAWLKGSAPAKPHYLPSLATRLLYIPLVPGLLPEYFVTVLAQSIANGKPLEGIIITTPGLGNIPSVEPYNFRVLIQQAVAAGVPVLISSQMPINPYTQDQYEHVSVPTKYGAIPAGNLTPGAAFAKFAWVIGCVSQEEIINPEQKAQRMELIKQKMWTDYVGEEGDFS